MEDDADDFETEESLADVFKAATICVRQIGTKFDADKLLYFYARYKQVWLYCWIVAVCFAFLKSECVTNARSVGYVDFDGVLFYIPRRKSERPGTF